MLTKQLSVFVENKKGRLSAILNRLAENGIDLSALSLADTSEFGVLRLIVSNPDKAKQILNDELPLSIGGGIGQSRLCMYLLKKIHIGEVQSSYWPDEDIKEFKKCNVNLL